MTAPLPELLDCAAYVYVLDCDHGVKVGITTQTIAKRILDLERGAGLRGIVVTRTWPMPSRSRARNVEMVAHWLLRDSRTAGEWFHCHPFEAADAIDRIIRHGVPVDYFRDGSVAA